MPDISGQMKKLPDADYLLEQLLHSTVDIIYFKDTQSRFVMYNPACARKHGWSTLEEGIGKTDFDVFTDEHAQNTLQDEQRVLATGETLLGIEEKETWPDGHVSWVSSSKVPLRDDSGNIIGLFGISRDITAQKNIRMQTQRYTEQINAIKEMLEEDARMAGKLQRSLFLADYPVFPAGVEPKDSCVEFLHHFNKCNLVSGDYCSIRRLSESKVSVMLCDVLGKGARAALGASLMRGIMQDIGDLADSPSAYLERLNGQLYPLLHSGKPLLDVTACYMVLDVTTGLVQLASAAHPLPLHFRPGLPVKWLYENLVLRGPALAVEPQARFRTITVRLQPGDSVVLFTDGLYSVKNAQGEPFSEKRLLGTAHRYAGGSLGRIFRGLEDEAKDFSKEEDFSDDVCLVGFHLRSLMEES